MIRIGLVGVGVMGRRYLEAFALDPNARVDAVCDPDLPRARAAAETYAVPKVYADVDDLLAQADVDAIVVATPDFAHRGAVTAALASGRHVLCEKPLATDVQDCVAIVEAVRQSGRQLMVNFGNRHRPSARRLKALIQDGRIGPVRYVYMSLNEKRVKTATLAWRERTSPLWFLLSHVTDTVRWLINDEIAQVVSVVGRAGPTSTDLPADAEEPQTTLGLMRFRRGAAAVLESTWDLPASHRQDVDVRIAVHGATGVITLDIGDQGLTVSDDATSNSVQWDTQPQPATVDDWWVRSCHYFTRTLLEGGVLKPNAEDGLAVVQALDGMQSSLDDLRVVNLLDPNSPDGKGAP
jgi:predicted dehydrogenase